jgi:hypothetical protein
MMFHLDMLANQLQPLGGHEALDRLALGLDAQPVAVLLAGGNAQIGTAERMAGGPAWCVHGFAPSRSRNELLGQVSIRIDTRSSDEGPLGWSQWDIACARPCENVGLGIAPKN